MSKLLELQRAVLPIKKDSENPFYKSKYFDINSLIAELKPILNELGLVLMQPLDTIDGKMALRTILKDGDKELVNLATILPDNPDPQKLGSIITYFRRYALQSLFCLQAEDDDAESTKIAYTSPQMAKTASPEFIKRVENFAQGKDTCQKCGAEMVFNPKTKKMFCKDKCWLRQEQIKEIQIDEELSNLQEPPF